MLGSEMLEVLIGIIFVFLLVSIICSAIREGIESWTKTRAAYLERGIRELLHDPEARGLARSLFEHPLIYSLYASPYTPAPARGKPGMLERGHGLPSYIPAASFASALMDIAARGPDPLVASDGRAPVLTLQSIRDNIANIENEPVQRVLLTAIDSAQGDLDRARLNIQAWFDASMDRVSGWYKRTSQWLIFWIGLATAIALNIDTLAIAEYLYRNDAARAAIVARAEAAVADTAFLSRQYAEVRRELEELGLPMGWGATSVVGDTGRGLWRSIFSPALGWLITALAATMGAPFWFDLLNKVMVIRSTVKPREKSPEEGSEDRQPRVTGGAEKTAPLHGGDGAEGVGAHDGSRSAAHGQPVEPRPIEDGCDVPITRVTRDEDLPPATGGVG